MSLFKKKKVRAVSDRSDSFAFCGEIPVLVRRRAVRQLRLAVRAPDGAVTLTVPRLVSEAQIEAFLLQKKAWILRSRARILHQAAERPVDLVTGETLLFRGVAYRLEVCGGAQNGLAFVGDRAVLTVCRPEDAALRKRAVLAAYRDELQKTATKWFSFWGEKTGLFCRSWQIRPMSTRWGSCSPQARTVRLNLWLAERPEEAVCYVVLHELLHLREANHGPRFQALLDAYLPEWKAIRRRLRAPQTALEKETERIKRDPATNV